MKKFYTYLLAEGFNTKNSSFLNTRKDKTL